MLEIYKLNLLGHATETRKVRVDGSQSDTISVGEAITLETDGNAIKLWGDGTPANALMFFGVVQSIIDNESGVTRDSVFPTTLPASHEGTLSVCIDPNATYAITGDDTLTVTHIGSNMNLVASGSYQLDVSTTSTDDRQFQVIDIFTSVGTSNIFAVVKPHKQFFARTSGI